MKIQNYILRLTLALVPVLPSMAFAQGVPHTFTAGSPAKANEVNDNFDALLARISALEAKNEALEARIEELEESPVQAMAAFVEVYPNPSLVPTDTGTQGPLIRFTDANVQIVSGAGKTDADPNGLGNLVVGYDEVRTGSDRQCSWGRWDNENDCVQKGGDWGVSHKTGSHNIVVGYRNNYGRYGGLVVGNQNSITGNYASVSGGNYGKAMGYSSSVAGGYGNIASGTSSVVSGGGSNEASGLYSSVSGGSLSTASAQSSSVTGGRRNEAAGYNSVVVGGGERNSDPYSTSGQGNKASGESSVIVGGRRNSAAEKSSVVLGGVSRSAVEDASNPPTQ